HVRLEDDIRHARAGDPDAVLALQIDQHVAPAFEADLGVVARDALAGVLEHEIALRTAADADGLTGQLDFTIERVAAKHQEPCHTPLSCVGLAPTLSRAVSPPDGQPGPDLYSTSCEAHP